LEDQLWSKVPLWLLPWTVKAKELKTYPFKVLTSWWMTTQDYASWRKSLKTAARAARKHKIPVYSIELHHHWSTPSCDLGQAEESRKTIVLCDNHPETALHELAHLWAQDRHTKEWARKLFLLHREFLSKEEVGFYQREAARMYKTAREIVEKERIRKVCVCGRRIK
jgi:hypothetical protein